MVFHVPLMCCEYMDVSFMKRVQPIQWAMESCDYALTGSKGYLCIHPSVLELFVNAKMCEPCPSCKIFM